MKNNLIAFSIFFLGLSLVAGSWLLSKSINENVSKTKETSLVTEIKNETINPQLFKKSELAIYLGLSEDEIEKLGPVPSGSNSTSSILPYLQIGETVYYSKKSIDKWLQNMETNIAY